MVLSDTWEYGPDVPARYASFGAGCAGAAGVPSLDAMPGRGPWLGDTFSVRVDMLPAGAAAVLLLTGTSRTSFGSIGLPLDLTLLGMPGCALRVRPTLVAVVSTQAGRAESSFPLCACPELLGAAFWQQALAPDPAANAAGFVWSNGGAAVIGGR